MCSIFGILDIKSDAVALRKTALEMSKRLRHRGPDWSGIYSTDKAILVHERLSIVDPGNGAQPLYNPERTHVLAVNGEIYNHKELEKTLTVDFQFQTGSDCEVILAKYKEKGAAFLDEINGIFAFILYDAVEDAYLIGRDHMGIIPMYMGYDERGNFYVASEMKALTPVCKSVQEFPPGHYLWSKDGELTRYYERDWMDYDNVKDNVTDKLALRDALEDAVKRQLMCDVPYGVLLSGGLDSSIISAVTKQYAARRVEDDGKSEAWWPQLHSFAVGLKGSPDLAAAQTASALPRHLVAGCRGNGAAVVRTSGMGYLCRAGLLWRGDSASRFFLSLFFTPGLLVAPALLLLLAWVHGRLPEPVCHALHLAAKRVDQRISALLVLGHGRLLALFFAGLSHLPGEEGADACQAAGLGRVEALFRTLSQRQ